MGVNGIYGLSGSGLDIESMVKVGMMSKKNEYDKMQQKYTQNEWKKAEYIDLYGKVQTFNNSTLSQYKLSTATNARGASSNDESKVTATANATAPIMSHYVEVGKLASSAYLVGTNELKSQNIGNTNSVQLSDAFFKDFTYIDNTKGKFTTQETSSEKITKLVKADGSTVETKENKNDKTVTTTITDSKGNPIMRYTQNNNSKIKLENYDSEAGDWVEDTSNSEIKMVTASSEKNLVQISYLDSDGRLNVANGDNIALSFNIGDGTSSSNKVFSSNENLFSVSAPTNLSLNDAYNVKVEVTDSIERAKVSSVDTGLNGGQGVAQLFGKMFNMDAADFQNSMTRYVNNNANASPNATAFSFDLGLSRPVNVTYKDLAADTTIDEFVKKLNSQIKSIDNNSDIQAEFTDGKLSFVNNKYGASSALDFTLVKSDSFAIPTAPYPITQSFKNIAANSRMTELLELSGSEYDNNTKLEFDFSVTDAYNDGNNVDGRISMSVAEISKLSVSEFISKLNKEFTTKKANITAEFVEENGSGKIKFSTNYVGEGSKLAIENLSPLMNSIFHSNAGEIFYAESEAFEYDGSDGNSASDFEKLAKFFGVNDNEDGSYSKSAIGSSGKVSIDGVDYDLTDKNSVTVKGITYTFVDGASGTGEVSNIGASKTINVTYEQLANGYTLNDLVSNINSLGTNVRAAYDTVQDKFSIYNKDSGSDNQILLTMNKDDSGASRAAELFNRMGLAKTANGELQTKEVLETTTSTTTSSNYVQMTDEDFWNIVDNQLYPKTVYINPLDADGNLIEGKYTAIELTEEEYSRIEDFLSSDANGRMTYYNGDDDPDGIGNSSYVYVLADVENVETGTSVSYVYDIQSFSSGSLYNLAGDNAIAKIDGVDYTLASNKVTVNGVIYSFNDVTSALNEDGTAVDSSASTSSKITIGVTQDTEAIVDKVKSFVEDYNTLLKTLYEWYDTKPDTNYKPLTETQKSAMKDEQIEKWEKKAKEGLLYHDRTLGDLIGKIRDAITDKIEGVNGAYNTSFAIGISTVGVKGQLTLDEDKLREALAADADSVYNVFARLDENDSYSSNGIAQRLGDVLTAGMKSIKSVSGTTEDISEDTELNNLLRELQTKMSNFKKMMAAFEEKLYKKYDAMESSLALLGAQLNYVTGAFGQ